MGYIVINVDQNSWQYTQKYDVYYKTIFNACLYLYGLYTILSFIQSIYAKYVNKYMYVWIDSFNLCWQSDKHHIQHSFYLLSKHLALKQAASNQMPCYRSYGFKLSNHKLSYAKLPLNIQHEQLTICDPMIPVWEKENVFVYF